MLSCSQDFILVSKNTLTQKNMSKAAKGLFEQGCMYSECWVNNYTESSS